MSAGLRPWPPGVAALDHESLDGVSTHDPRTNGAFQRLVYPCPACERTWLHPAAGAAPTADSYRSA